LDEINHDDVPQQGDTRLDEQTQAITDESLMLAYSQGLAIAFDQLYQRHKAAVYRYFLRQNASPAIAEELSHDTWLKIINARENYVVSALFKTYLFTIARRIVIDYKNKKSNQDQQHLAPVEIEQHIEHKSLTQQFDQQAVLLLVKQKIAALPADQQEVFLLKQEAGFSIEEIAQITEQHKEKVKSRWRYAIQKLRKGLSAYVK
jgi:RNA polymerase sigma-70 factor (ECF subfamily)